MNTVITQIRAVSTDQTNDNAGVSFSMSRLDAHWFDAVFGGVRWNEDRVTKDTNARHAVNI